MWYLVKTLERQPGETEWTRAQVRLHRGSADYVHENQQWKVWNAKQKTERADRILDSAETLEEILEVMGWYLRSVGMRVRR